MNKFYKDKQQIINWLKNYEFKSYTLVPDEKYRFVIDVSGNVNLSDKDLINIPVKFNKINGDFNCSDNQLTSLEFCPETVSGSFWCSNNKLKSLEFCPETVNGSFDCSYNKLTSLEFCPERVGGGFWCSHNKLTSLDFCPQEVVGGNFYCNGNKKLKQIQEITNFKLIYLEHKKILIAKLSDKLENNLINDNSKKSAKIKI